MSLPDLITIRDESEFYAIGVIEDSTRWPTLEMGDELARAGYMVTHMDPSARTLTLVKLGALKEQGGKV